MEGFRDRFNKARTKSKVDPMPHDLASPEYRPPTIREQIQTAIRSELSMRAQDMGLETFEEADDFEDPDPEDVGLTIYEQALMVPENDESLDGSPEPVESTEPDAAPTPATDTPEPPAAPDEAPASS